MVLQIKQRERKCCRSYQHDDERQLVQALRPPPESTELRGNIDVPVNVYRGLAWPTDCHRISHLTLEMPLRGIQYYPYCTDEDTGSERWVTLPRSHSKPVVELEFTSAFVSMETFAPTSPLAVFSQLQKDHTCAQGAAQPSFVAECPLRQESLSDHLCESGLLKSRACAWSSFCCWGCRGGY